MLDTIKLNNNDIEFYKQVLSHYDSIVVDKHRTIYNNLYRDIYQDDTTYLDFRLYLTLLMYSNLYNLHVRDIISKMYTDMIKCPEKQDEYEMYFFDIVYLHGFYNIKDTFMIKKRNKNLSDLIFLGIIEIDNNIYTKLKQYLTDTIIGLDKMYQEYKSLPYYRQQC